METEQEVIKIIDLSKDNWQLYFIELCDFLKKEG